LNNRVPCQCSREASAASLATVSAGPNRRDADGGCPTRLKMISHRPLSGCDGHHILAQFRPSQPATRVVRSWKQGSRGRDVQFRTRRASPSRSHAASMAASRSAVGQFAVGLAVVCYDQSYLGHGNARDRATGTAQPTDTLRFFGLSRTHPSIISRS